VLVDLDIADAPLEEVAARVWAADVLRAGWVADSPAPYNIALALRRSWVAMTGLDLLT
jgi:hypothetical protein